MKLLDMTEQRYPQWLRFLSGFAVPFMIVLGYLFGTMLNPRCAGSWSQLLSLPRAMALFSFVWVPLSVITGLLALGLSRDTVPAVRRTAWIFAILAVLAAAPAICGYSVTPPCWFTP